MSNTRDTGFLRNLISYDASGNIVLPANLTVTGTLLSSGGATYATQSYVTTQITNLVNAAPGALDTLGELATALGNDANFATTVTNSIAAKQAALSGTGFVKISGTTISYDNSTYLTTSSASSTYLPLSGGTLTGGLTGTTGVFSSSIAINAANASTFSLYVNGDVYGSTGFYTRNSAATFIGSANNTVGMSVDASTGVTKIASGGNYTMYLTGTNQVGIGTASPSSLLELNKNSNSGSGSTFPRLNIVNSLTTQGDGSTSYNFADIRLAAGNTAVEMYMTATYAGGSWAPQGIINVATNHPLAFKTNNTERFTISNAGYGTFKRSLTVGQSDSTGSININGTNDSYMEMYDGSTTARMYTSNGWAFGIYAQSGASVTDIIYYDYTSKYLVFGTNGANRMRITSAGNVGIGTGSPSTNLHVAIPNVANNKAEIFRLSDGVTTDFKIYLNRGTDTSNSISVVNTYASNMSFETNNTERIRLVGGNFGIGTISPSSRLSLGMGIGAKFMVYDNPSTGVYAGIGQDLAGGNSTDFFAHSYGNYGFLTFGKLGTNGSTYTEWARINPSGNVGIGNTDPLQALGRTLTVEGTGIFQTTVGGGSYNENLRLNRTGNGYSAIAMGGAYNSTSGSGVGVWTLAATPSGVGYRFDFDYNGGTRLAIRTDGQIIQGGVGIVQIVPIGPTATNISYTATVNTQVTIGSASIPSNARWLLADIFLTANISDHQNFMLTRSNFGAQKTWVDTRGNNPANEFGNLTQDDVAILTYNGESDGYSPNYGIWKSSVLVPSSGRNVWINNYGNSNSNGYVYFIVRGYSL